MTQSALTYSSRRFLRCCLLLLSLVACHAAALAQGTTTTRATDGKTPAAMAPGSPAGSYPLSGFDDINLYNQSLGFRLPLLRVGGRGSAGYAAALPVERKWRVDHTVDNPTPSGCNPYPNCERFEPVNVYKPNSDWHTDLKPGFGPGVLVARHAGYKSSFVPGCGPQPLLTLTRLTFITPDGTEYELRDTKYGGAPQPRAGCNLGVSRGTEFVTSDGSFATFVASAEVRDYVTVGSDEDANQLVSGTLYLRDGTRYGVVGSRVEWIRDRNGNEVRFHHSVPHPTRPGVSASKAVDPLGRETFYTFGEIVYKGFGGEWQTVRVLRGALSTRLRPANSEHGAETPKTYAQLFPSIPLTGGGPTTAGNTAHMNSSFDADVVTAVELPDGRRYEFYYNSYGELARVELPTGGAFEYDYQADPGVVTQGGNFQIFRRIVERRVYKEGGQLEGVTTFGPCDGVAPGFGNSCMQVDRLDPHPSPDASSCAHPTTGRRLVSRTRHFFHGTPVPGLYSEPTHYSAWDEGKEFKTESYACDGTTLLRQVEQAWRQRELIAWWDGFNQTQRGPEPSHDPRVVETRVTLADSNLVSLTSALDPAKAPDDPTAVGFDRFNNPTDLWEYDFGEPGTGVPGPLLRHAHTDYLTTSGGVDYTGYAGGGPHLRGLPTGQQVYYRNPSTGGETLAAKSETRYDEAGYPLLACDVENNIACSSATGWAAPVTAARGNVTTERRWLDTDNTWVETHAQYDGLGRVRKAWDARGKLSQVTYTDADGTNALGTFAFATRVLTPDPDGGGPRAPLASETRYDHATGLVVSSTDANDQTTAYSYADEQGTLDPLGRLRKVTRPDGGRTRYEYGDTLGDLFVRTLTDIDAARMAESRQYFDGLGRAARSLSWENQDASKPWLTTDVEYDALGRARRVSNQYRASGPESAVNPAGRWTTTGYDALGRITEVETPDGAKAVTAYAGNAVTVTDQAGKKRRSVTDALGRLVRVDEPDKDTGALDTAAGTPIQPTHYAYDVLGNLRKVEQGGQLRFFAYDSLSRLLRVKNPEQTPSATVLGTLRLPAGLLSPMSDNNNDWSLSYLYDADGNLRQRTDARGITATYTYDDLSRNTSVIYTGEQGQVTPPITRAYDGAIRGRGRLHWSEAAGVSRTTFDAYDEVGRPTAYRQQFWTGSGWGPNYFVGREYDLAGNVKSQTYPSGRAVNYEYDAAGRLSAFTGNLGDGSPRSYSTGVTYDELGGMKREQFGTDTPLYNKRSYNVRGQLAEVRVGTYHATDQGWWNRGAILNVYSTAPADGWTATGPDNNGNLRKQMIFIPHGENPTGGDGWTELAQYYEYDALNRLDYVRETQGGQNRWMQDYDYDRWGNRTINRANTQVYGQNPSYSIPEPQLDKRDLQNTNRLYAPGDMDPGKAEAQRKMRYDGAGNLTQDLCHDDTTRCLRSYDAEGRMTSAQFLNGQVQTVRYTYDADGRRVTHGGGREGQVRQVYGFDGELLAEYTPQAAPAAPRKEYGYRAGELLVTAESPDAAGRANFALAVAGATALASSTLDDQRSPAGAIDGDRAGHNWGAGGGWHDRTPNAFPDWLEVDFGSQKTIDEIDVFSVQDTYWSPQEPSEAAAFTQYGLIDFDVQRWDGSNWVTVQGGEVRGNNLVWRRLKFAPVTTQKVRLLVRAGQAGHSRVAELEAWGPSGPPPPRLNVAAAAAGATATASSTLDAGRAASGAINGDRAGRNWGAGGGWHDSSPDAFPDWLEISFAGSRTVDEVSVFSIQNNFLSPAEPTEQMTFSQYGLTSFEVQWWDGADWRTAASVAGNNLVWRKVSFTSVTTAKIRVQVNGALARYSRIAEVEAYGGAAQADVRWLVTDHLGTPRMVFDQTGKLTSSDGRSGMRRHDYFPFGEEIGADVGVRTTAQGYTGDSVRQQFTSKERDAETELDYFGARYYSSAQGRFNSTDPMFISNSHSINPQRWNLYAYVNNNPLVLIDPDGRNPQGKGGNKTIDVYLTISSKELNKSLWRRVESAAKKSGYTVKVFTQDKTSMESVKESLKSSEAVVFFGHGAGYERSTTGGRFETVTLELGTQTSGGGWLTSEGWTPQRQIPLTEYVPAKLDTNAQAVALFSCNSTQLPSAFNMQGEDQAMVVNTGGRDGLTALPTMEKSVAAFITTYARTNGDVDRAVQAGQKVINADRNVEIEGGANNRGDRLISKRND
jgi:RHS repeat-associated protein